MAKQSLEKDIRLFLERKKQMESYEIQEDILRHLVGKYPEHSSFAAVDVKAKLLNLFYSTGIQAITKMSENIFAIKDIDGRLQKGDHSLVAEIAELKLDSGTRINYSFATKYCALHQPAKFPIYDSIVAAVFARLMADGNLPPYSQKKGGGASTYLCMTKGTFQANLRNYEFFVRGYDTFMQDFGLQNRAGITYREVDWYLWGAYKLPGSECLIEKLAPLSGNKYFEYKKK